MTEPLTLSSCNGYFSVNCRIVLAPKERVKDFSQIHSFTRSTLLKHPLKEPIIRKIPKEKLKVFFAEGRSV